MTNETNIYFITLEIIHINLLPLFQNFEELQKSSILIGSSLEDLKKL